MKEVLEALEDLRFVIKIESSTGVPFSIDVTSLEPFLERAEAQPHPVEMVPGAVYVFVSETAGFLQSLEERLQRAGLQAMRQELDGFEVVLWRHDGREGMISRMSMIPRAIFATG
jgi:hypothetical protein